MNYSATHRIAIKILLGILSLFVVFHLLILSGLIPFEVVWGGKLQDKNQMQLFEGVSIIINLAMLAFVGAHAGLIKLSIKRKVMKAVLWLMFVLFSFNTVGNALSDNALEKMLFAPVTFVLAFCCLVLVRSKEAETTHSN